MRVLGRVNWLAPKPLARLHERFGISVSHDLPEIEPPAAETGQRVDLPS
jgi:putative drug exporter of the RND superfamily